MFRRAADGGIDIKHAHASLKCLAHSCPRPPLPPPPACLCNSSEQGGRLSLVDITSVRKFEGGEHGNFTFIVHGSDRDVLLRAETANDASRWVRGLTLQIDLVRGGTFQGPPSVKNQRKTVPRVLGDMQEGAGGGGGERGSLGCVGGGTSTATQKKQQQQQQQLEHSHFREINDRIRAIMDDRVDGSTRRNTATVDQVTVGGGEREKEGQERGRGVSHPTL